MNDSNDSKFILGVMAFAVIICVGICVLAKHQADERLQQQEYQRAITMKKLLVLVVESLVLQKSTLSEQTAVNDKKLIKATNDLAKVMTELSAHVSPENLPDFEKQLEAFKKIEEEVKFLQLIAPVYHDLTELMTELKRFEESLNENYD